ncbi:MAG: carbohydrate kinase family protein, partial [Aliifodinibius sp.]|nr:carbohydrate kinase family protein [Fodinibius sp.]NIW45625.1 carbohydrate kinase family protein [Gammaproteobacteria bacterium]NIX56826.1 carbohydrate kinase family protein [candidate division Zixibacteria bacterium]NIY26621.1 carbohydrate kinase family protein [Fodinibius sp.]
AGAVGSREGVLYSHPGFKMEAVETTGAGDSFNAGFLYQFLQGSNMEECLRWGNACGAIAVTALGGSGAFTNRHNLQIQLDRLLKNEYSSLEPN